MSPAAPSNSAAPPQRERRAAWRGALLALAVAAVYANSLGGAFQYDDGHSIVRNPHIRQLSEVPRFFVDPATFSGDADKGMYRPLLLTSYALNYATHGYEVAGYHVINILLHAGSVLVLWRLAVLLGGPGAGLAAALLFAVHPLVTEPVNYISSRSELLLGVFFLTGLWAHVVAHRGGGPRWGGLAAIACALALMSKATAVVLAPALVAVDVLLLGWRPSGAAAALRRHGLYWGLTGAYLAIIAATGFLGGSVATPVRGAAAQFWTQLKAPAYYGRLLSMPRPLSIEHAFAESLGPTPAACLGLAFLLSMAWLVLRARRAFPRVATSLIVGGFVLLPTSIMPLNVLVNERRLYLVVAVAALAVVSLARRCRMLPIAVAVMALCLLTLQRNGAWASPVRLWESARDAGATSYRTWVNLGKAYQEEGRRDDARQAYERALSVDDRHGDAYNNLAVLLHEDGRLDEAVAAYREALQRMPGMDEIRTNLADAYTRLGHLDEAVAVYREALSLDSTNGAAWNNMGEVLLRLGHHAEAADAFRRATRTLADRHEPYNNLGNALDAAGDRAGAAAAYRAALARTDVPTVRGIIHANLGETLRRLGDPSAGEHLDSAIALQPTAAAHDFRGRLAWDVGDTARARRAWEQSVRLDPERGSAWTGLGEVALSVGDVPAAVIALQRAVAAGGGNRARLQLGTALERAGRLDEARRAYAELARHGRPQDTRVATARSRLEALDNSDGAAGSPSRRPAATRGNP